MPRCPSLIATVVVLAACGSSAATPSPPAVARCGPAPARTLASSSGARVYAQGEFVYACYRASGRRYRLGTARRCVGSARVGPATAAGAVIAYAVQRCGLDTGRAAVVVRRVSDGARLLVHPALTGPSGPESFGSVGSIVVDRRGAVAWIAGEHSVASHHLLVQVIEATGSGVRVLAAGERIDLGSLRRHGPKLTWAAGGAEHSATLG